MGQVMRFALPFPTPLLNRTLRQHWSGRLREQRALSWEVRVALGKQPLPAEPFRRARVTIIRRSAGTPDQDGLMGGVKGLVDVLKRQGDPILPKRGALKAPRLPNPTGLGIIWDDAPQHLDLVVRAERVSRAQQGTCVTIEELD